MAHPHPRGQIAVEATIVVMVLALGLIMIGSHLSFAKNKFEKMELTKEVLHENQRIYRKK